MEEVEYNTAYEAVKVDESEQKTMVKTKKTVE